MILEAAWMAAHTAKSCLRTLFRQWPRQIRDWARFWRSYSAYRRAAPKGEKPSLRYLYPCLGDDTAETAIEPIYFYQDTWAFEKIVGRRPAAHVDVGSHHKFVAFLSLVLPVTFIDIRPLSLEFKPLRFREGSLLALPYSDGSVESLSSLCVVEHIGLGRYGDPLDPFGTEKAIAELKRVLKPGGNLYISLPVDDERRVYFNAHRAFLDAEVRRLLEPLRIIEAKYIYGRRFIDRVAPGFGVACYHLERPA